MDLCFWAIEKSQFCHLFTWRLGKHEILSFQERPDVPLNICIRGILSFNIHSRTSYCEIFQKLDMSSMHNLIFYSSHYCTNCFVYISKCIWMQWACQFRFHDSLKIVFNHFIGVAGWRLISLFLWDNIVGNDQAPIVVFSNSGDLQLQFFNKLINFVS